MEYPDAKRSIRLCLGAMRLLRVTTNGLECAAIAQKTVRICCHITWGHRSTRFGTVEGLFEMLGSRFLGASRVRQAHAAPHKHHFKLINKCQDFTEADKAQVKT